MTHSQTDYYLYKQAAALLDKEVSITSKALQKFPRGAMGLTPDDVKATPEWKAAKKAFDDAFNKLRKFNAVFVKKYKKEIAADRIAAQSR